MANIKISELPAAASVSTTDILVLNQGSTTRKATVAQALVGALTTDQIAGLTTSPAAALATTGVAGLSNYAARADHQHLFPTAAEVGAPPTSRTISAGTGLTGGGDLSANRTLTVSYGTTAGTAAQGNDSRLSDSRTPSGAAGGDLGGAYPNPTINTVPIAKGGTGQTTRQAAMDALAGATTSGEYLRGNGTEVVMSAIQAADVPTLNQNTTGTAANVTGTVAIANGGTGANNSDAVLANLGILAQIRICSGGRVNLPAGTISGQVYTTSTNQVLASLETGVTLVNGDLIFVIQGAVSAANFGFWIITDVGSASTPTILTRPSWFQNGNTGLGQYFAQIPKSSTVQGCVFNLVPSTSSASLPVIGTTLWTSAQVIGRAQNAVLSSNTFTGIQTLAANSTTVAPLVFQSGALNTTPTAGRVEWDGNFQYNVTSGAVRTQQAAFVPAPATVTSTGVAGQIAFDGNNLYVCTATNTWRRATLTTF